jgi:hypothetical protein
LVGFGWRIHPSFRNWPSGSKNHEAKDNIVKVWRKLQNPYALVVQGFLVGGLLFWTTQGEAGQPAAASVASTLSALASH